tara:strand:+ start:293 stop:1735 length:1443 start_codon:yes stop_codon:yes gene_type:complete
MAESKKVTTAQANPAAIKKIDIFSNKRPGITVSIANGVVELRYYESVLQDSIIVTVNYADSGNTIEDERGIVVSAVEGLPIVGEEKVEFSIEDNNENVIDLTFLVNNVSPFNDDTTKGMVGLKFVSEEYELNEEVRVNKRFEEKPSDAVKRILTEFLQTKKEMDIEESTECITIPAQKKPFYALNWLCTRSAPANKPPGTTAGFFFFETSEGYHFKSIDFLFDQEEKKRIIYNETPDNRGADIPEGYDISALSYVKDNRVDVQRKKEAGFQTTRLITFDLWDCDYKIINPIAPKDLGGVEPQYDMGAKELPIMNKEIADKTNTLGIKFSRTTWVIRDTGALRPGSTQEQLEKSKEENLKVDKIKNQAILRFNQVYSSQIEITIPGDFSLHAGDAIYFDAPSAQMETKNDDIDRYAGGLYIISALCHLINPQGTFTKLNLVRDSFGRKGKAKTGKPAADTKIPGVKLSSQRTAPYDTITTF